METQLVHRVNQLEQGSNDQKKSCSLGFLERSEPISLQSLTDT